MQQASLKITMREPVQLSEPMVGPEIRHEQSVAKKVPAPTNSTAEKSESASPSKPVKPAPGKSAKALELPRQGLGHPGAAATSGAAHVDQLRDR